MLENLLNQIESMLCELTSEAEKIAVINAVKASLYRHSPFNTEPVDCVMWIPASDIVANDYNPNVMAPAEKRLLRHSIETEGFTQPIVVSPLTKKKFQVVDGYHRYQAGKTTAITRERLRGYLPVTVVNTSSQGLAERIAATIRHNRARGKHQIDEMCDVVRDLARLGWTDAKISKELGMDTDEVLRLKQLSGLAELFIDDDFSDAWTVS